MVAATSSIAPERAGEIDCVIGVAVFLCLSHANVSLSLRHRDGSNGRSNMQK
jgi:hypothetical protein